MKTLIIAFLFLFITSVSVAQNVNCFYQPTASMYTISPNSDSHAIAWGDYNNDGHLDMAVSGNNIINIFLGNSTGMFTNGNNIFLNLGLAPAINNLISVDFNSDSNLDLAFANNGTVRIANGDGTGNFTTSILSNTSCQTPGDIYADLLNIDNNVDLIVGSKCNPAFYSYYGNGNNNMISTASTNTPSGGMVHSILSHDINLDGLPEIIASFRISNSVGVYSGSAANTYTNFTLYPVTGGPTVLRKSDFNNDGFIDLITLNTVTHGYSVLLGTSTFSFSPAQTTTLTAGARYMDVADFNLDGFPDLAISFDEAATDYIRIYEGLGDGTFSATSITLAVGSNPTCFRALDLNNDSKPDIFCTNKGSNNAYVWLNGYILLGATPSYTACSGSTLTLSASGAQTYNWSFGGNGSIVSYPVSTNTVLQVTGSNSLSGCSVNKSVSITALASPTINISSSASVICSGQTATVTASGADSYLWNNAATTSVIVVQLNNSTNLTVNGFNSNNCQAIASISITVNPCTGIYEEFVSDIKFFPVPATDYLTIEGSHISKIEILSTVGTLLLSETLTNYNSVVNISHFASGLYYLKISGVNGSKTFPVSVIK